MGLEVVQISWQARHFVDLEVQIWWHVQRFVTLKCRFCGRHSKCAFMYGCSPFICVFFGPPALITRHLPPPLQMWTYRPTTHPPTTFTTTVTTTTTTVIITTITAFVREECFGCPHETCRSLHVVLRR